mgnify:CR=1 FL=1
MPPDSPCVVRDSSYSIVKLAVLMCCSFLAMDLFYRGRKLAKLYLLLVFYAVYEMSRMTLHSVWSVTNKLTVFLLRQIDPVSRAYGDALMVITADSIALREKYRSIGKILFFLQTFLVGCWISESVWVNRILYGNEEGMVRDSSYSIVKSGLPCVR